MKRLIYFFVLILSTTIFPQGIRFGIGGGLTILSSPDAFTNDISSGGYNFSSEYHVGVAAKIDIPVIPIRPVAFLKYHMLNGSQSTPLGEYEVSQNILSLGAGAEWSLIPGPLSPYLALEAAMNNFSKVDITAPSGSNLIIPGGSGVTRVGLGLGAGLEFGLIPGLGLDASAKYHFLNIIGKTSGEETVGVFVLNVSIFL